MKLLPITLIFVILMSAGISVTGCDSPGSAENPKEKAHFKVLGILYGKYLSGSAGQPPADREKFVSYLNANKPSWEKIVDSPEQLLTSPRDGKPFVIFYGEDFVQNRPDGTLWVAHESEGVGVVRLAVNARGFTQEFDEAAFQKVFP